ncbi:MAG: TonB-dependent receptor [Daejeonella sp.]|uniref:outer membrane beta-barrel protein n=1 Tax=Daejeonella sp. TaxID=2805397 RepID=UPI003C74429C
MNNKLIFFVCLFFLGTSVFAQTFRNVSGVVQDSTGAGVFSATVKLVPLSGGDTLQTRSDVDGNFAFRGVTTSSFNIFVNSLGYAAITISSRNPDGTTPIVLPKITLKASSRLIDEVVVSGRPPVLIKTDTVEYRMSDLKMKPDAVVEDAIKRLEGTEVDKDGNVTAAGKPVTKIKVNGKEVFGGDMKTITKNIPADAIDKIQIVEDYGDQANFTGVKEGDPETIINITTRPGRDHGYIVNSTVGGGTIERYQAGLFAQQMKGDRILGINANLNNNGTQIGGENFGGRNGQRFSGGGGPGGGGFGGGGFGGGSGGTGITNLGSLALNYNNKFGEALKLAASYYFNNQDRNTISTVFRQSANTLGSILSTEFNDANNINTRHGFNARLEYNINKTNLLVVTPFLSFGKTSNLSSGSVFQTGVINQNQISVTNNESLTPSVNVNVLYNHLFAKPKRNYSINLNFRNSNFESDQENDNHITYNDASGNTLKDSLNFRLNSTANRTQSAGSRLVYNEPISEKGRIQFNYDVNYNKYDNSRISSLANGAGILVPIDSLSNVFDYSFVSQRIGANYNYQDKNSELSLGLTANPTHLSGNSASLNTSINRTNFFIAPIARYQYRFAGTKSITFNYFGNAAEPQFAQLQPVRDVSNPQRPVVGNPDLNSSFSHFVFGNLRLSNVEKRTSLMIYVQGNAISNQIVQNVVLIPDVFGSRKQEVRYVNTNGYYTYFGGYNWSKSFADRQYTVRLNGDSRFTRGVSLADNIKNFSNRRNINQRIALQINPGEWMELSPQVMYGRTVTDYTLATNTDTKINTYGLNMEGRFLLMKDKSLIFGFDGSKQFNSGYIGNLNTNPFVLNSYVEKKFKKNLATLRLQAFDIFDQSNNISQAVIDNGFTDTQTNRLTRYFMLTLNVRINKFAGGTQQNAPRPDGERFEGRPGGFDRGGMPGGGVRREND